MLISYSRLIGTPVLSVHVGAQIARITACLVDPDTLKIIAFLIDGPMVTADTGDVLDIKSIREFSNLGFVIDSDDVISRREDIVKVKKIIDLDFILVGLKVETKKGAKLGKIDDFIVTSDTFTVQQLVVKRPALKSFLDPELTINRSEIVEVNDTHVIVKEEKQGASSAAGLDKSNFVNPFRGQDFSQSENRNLDASDTE